MKLSEHQERVRSAMFPQNKDVPIDDIFRAVYGVAAARKVTIREMQQKLAPTFAAINKKLHKAKIEPGLIKQTYCYRHPAKG